MTDNGIETEIEDRLPRETTEGRGNGDGRWLERQLSRAFRRWGYSVSLRQSVYGLEVDVVAKRAEPQNDPTDWLVAECKDWETRPITPDVLYRLCMLAHTCRAMPVLCHTTSLTDRARRIAHKWEVRVLTLQDLHRGALPAPTVATPTADLRDYRAQYTVREARGTLPFPFCNDPENHFTYVPGFEPIGRMCEYQPIDNAENDSADDRGE